MNYSPFRDAIKNTDVRYTRVRGDLFDLLLQLSPIAARDFIEHAKQNGFDTVSVYRNLKLFKMLGLYDEFGFGSRRMLHAHEKQYNHHHFIRCTSCNRVIEFENEAIEMQLNAIALRAGFSKVTSHYLEIIGLCGECSKLTRIA